MRKGVNEKRCKKGNTNNKTKKNTKKCMETFVEK